MAILLWANMALVWDGLVWSPEAAEPASGKPHPIVTSAFISDRRWIKEQLTYLRCVLVTQGWLLGYYLPQFPVEQLSC